MKKKWEFVYEEDVYDTYGLNFIGVISNGEHFLFFHSLKHYENDPIERCYIYSSMLCLSQSVQHECVYDWTAENDSILINYLNENNFEVGEGSGLQNLKFLPYTECESYTEYENNDPTE